VASLSVSDASTNILTPALYTLGAQNYWTCQTWSMDGGRHHLLNHWHTASWTSVSALSPTSPPERHSNSTVKHHITTQQNNLKQYDITPTENDVKAIECVSEYGNLSWTHTPSHDKHIGWSSSSIHLHLSSVTLLHPQSVISWCLCWPCLARWCVANTVVFYHLAHSVTLVLLLFC